MSGWGRRRNRQRNREGELDRKRERKRAIYLFRKILKYAFV